MNLGTLAAEISFVMPLLEHSLMMKAAAFSKHRLNGRFVSSLRRLLNLSPIAIILPL